MTEPQRHTHNLKTLPSYFQAVIEGRKNFEVRSNDRGFQVEDFIVLHEWDGCIYTGRQTTPIRITYMTDFGAMAGMVVLGLEMHSYQLEDARAHVTAYWSARGVVDLLRSTSVANGPGMLMAAMKSMDASLAALTRIKGIVPDEIWWKWCCECQPLQILEAMETTAAEISRTLQEASLACGLPQAVTAGYIQALAKHLTA